MNIIAPVAEKDRIVLMDILRGFAILGIFIANLPFFTFYFMEPKEIGPLFSPTWDHKLYFLQHMLIEGKFYSIFSLLFGWGIALQLQRLSEKNSNDTSLIKRRLFIMLLFGLLHIVLLWIGDIVAFYAMLGFILLPLRKFSNKTLLITAVILILSPILLYWLKMTWPVLAAPSGILFETGNKIDAQLSGFKSQEDFKNVLLHGSYIDMVKTNISGFFYRYADLIFISRIEKVLGMFLIGFVVGRSNIYQHIEKYRKLLFILLIGGLVIGLPANYILANYMLSEGDYYNLKINGFYQTCWYAIGVAPLSLAYVAGITLIFLRNRSGKLLRIFAPVGKMAFSNYIFQTLVGVFVFFGFGLGYALKTGPLAYIIFGILVYCWQIIFSTWWLKNYHFGPLEWLWRSLTYKKTQPFKRKTSSSYNIG